MRNVECFQRRGQFEATQVTESTQAVSKGREGHGETTHAHRQKGGQRKANWTNKQTSRDTAQSRGFSHPAVSFSHPYLSGRFLNAWIFPINYLKWCSKFKLRLNIGGDCITCASLLDAPLWYFIALYHMRLLVVIIPIGTHCGGSSSWVIFSHLLKIVWSKIYQVAYDLGRGKTF